MNYFDNIPNELKQIPQWVGVRFDSKIPLDPEGRAASTSNPDTWADFYTMATLYNEVGFVFRDNGIVGIDIDDGWSDDEVADGVRYKIQEVAEAVEE